MTLRFGSGGGRPPASHEVLLVDEDGGAWYLTGMPWPGQPPFHEIGAYRGDLGHAGAERLRALARACLAAPPQAPGFADAGTERLRLGDEEARWSRRDRAEPMQRFVEAARAAITTLRGTPVGAVRGELVGDRVRLTNPGSQPLEMSGGELRAGWGRSQPPPSPLRIAERPPTPATLPARLEPGESVELPLPDPGTSEDPDIFDTPYALVHLRWRPPIDAEGDELDGWLVAGRPAGAPQHRAAPRVA